MTSEYTGLRFANMPDQRTGRRFYVGRGAFPLPFLIYDTGIDRLAIFGLLVDRPPLLLTVVTRHFFTQPRLRAPAAPRGTFPTASLFSLLVFSTTNL